MELKKPLSFEDQVSRLIEHGMSVQSKRDAAFFLSNVNYYRFAGYALQFRADNQQDYIQGTSFGTVKNIYLFDEELRGVLRDALDCAELCFGQKFQMDLQWLNVRSLHMTSIMIQRILSDLKCSRVFWILSKRKKHGARTALWYSIIRANMETGCHFGL